MSNRLKALPGCSPALRRRVWKRRLKEMEAWFASDFETPKVCIERRNELVRTLQIGAEDGSEELAARLGCCHKRAPCDSAACPVCERSRREERVRAVVDLFGESKHLVRVSCVHPSWAQDAGQLHTLDLRKIRDQVRKHLIRGGLGEAVVVGGIDISWNKHSDGRWPPHWQAHVYLIIEGHRAKDVKEALARFYPKSSSIPRPLHTLEVDNLARASSYCFKAMFYQRSSYTDPETCRSNTRRVSLKSKQERELRIFLHRQRHDARLITRNLIRKTGKLTLRKG